MPVKTEKSRLYGGALLLAVVILAADQFTKYMALSCCRTHFIEVTPFFNIVLVWNRGISFGIFNHHSDLGPYLLIALSLTIIAVFGFWLRKVNHQPLQVAICAVIAGALGNVIDRLHHGAVVDFLDFHIGRHHYPAFNIADSAVVLGIAFILLDSIFFEPRRQKGAANAAHHKETGHEE